MKFKKSKADFSADKLPSTRKQLFFDIYKNRFWLILGLGFILFVSLLPFIIVYAIGNLKVYELNLKATEGIISVADASKEIFSMISARNLAIIPCLVLFAVGFSGVAGIIRRLVWQEGIIFWSDFFKSLKENAFSFSVIAFVIGCLNYLLQYSARSLYFREGFSAQASTCVSIIALAIILLITPCFITQSTVYNLPFFGKLKNAFMLSMRAPLKSFILLIVNVSPCFTLLIPGKYAFTACCVLLPIFIMPAQIIVDTLCCDSVLDEFVNKNNFKEIYKKGLYNAENNDD